MSKLFVISALAGALLLGIGPHVLSQGCGGPGCGHGAGWGTSGPWGCTGWGWLGGGWGGYATGQRLYIYPAPSCPVGLPSSSGLGFGFPVAVPAAPLPADGAYPTATTVPAHPVATFGRVVP